VLRSKVGYPTTELTIGYYHWHLLMGYYLVDKYEILRCDIK